jgi:putative transposase
MLIGKHLLPWLKVSGYVIMPEHVHLLIFEPWIGDPSKIIQAAKLEQLPAVAIGGEFSGRFWESRFYDFNLWGQQKEVEKLKYMHRNPGVAQTGSESGGLAVE